MTHPFFLQHKERLDTAIQTCRTREYWSPFEESPSKSKHPVGAHEQGRQNFATYIQDHVSLSQAGSIGWVGKEISPYTQEPLDCTYPKVDIPVLLKRMQEAQPQWRDTTLETRIGLGLELLERWNKNNFVNAYATMHTAGQAFMMAFAGSGANALDRGMEALVHAYIAQSQIPTHADFYRNFGRNENPTHIHKTYRLIPRGIAVVICCGTFPTWNAYPSILASFCTGNPVIVKPHPNGILPMAIAVKTAQQLLEEQGFDPNLVTLCADEPDSPVTKELMDHPLVRIIDFTGSPHFGNYIEKTYRNKQVYTETAGCNSVLIESTDNYEGMIHAIAQSLCLFSAQMCTSAQNIFVSQKGVDIFDNMGTKIRSVSPSAFSSDLRDAIQNITKNPKMAAAVCGCVMSSKTLQDIQELRVIGKKEGKIILDSTSYEHPDFPNAQTATPLVVELDVHQKHIYQREFFGPMSFVIICEHVEQAVERATSDVRDFGAISSYVYSVSHKKEWIEEQYILAGASVGCNLIEHLPINFAAAYSDFHVTGLNPAGNACLTDLAFVSNRFRIVQSKTEIPHQPSSPQED